MSTALLEADDLVVRYDAATVLDGVGLGVTEGEMVGVIGPNGAGKSTLFRALAGLATPDAGGVRLAGRPIAAWRRRDLARKLAYLPQGTEIHWPITVGRLVGLGRLPHLAPWQRLSPHDSEAIAKALAAADVADLAGRRVDTLSAGERARALLARALAVEAPILLADEPVAGLDPYHQLRVMELLRRSAHRGAAVAVVLHDLTLAARFCDRVLVLRAGRALAEGPPREAMTAAIIEHAYGISVIAGARDGEPYLVPWQRRGAGEDERAPEAPAQTERA